MNYRLRLTHSLQALKGVTVQRSAIALLPIILLVAVLTLSSCTNNPYRESEDEGSVYYTTFSEPPKHLDPARSYSSDEYTFISQIYEPTVQYHYLKRPYELTPLTATAVPKAEYYDRGGRRLPDSAPPGEVDKAIYKITIKEGIVYSPHPAFARDDSGEYLYRNLGEEEVRGIKEIRDFKERGTRELTSDDYIYQIKRLADPRLHSPILPILNKYILGLEEFSAGLAADLAALRAERKEAAGAAYNQLLDEKRNPIRLDYDSRPLPGVIRVDDRTYKVILKRKYPQFVYWLAMPFFSPMPREAIDFYSEPLLIDGNITIDRFPVGTGAYHLHTYRPNREIILARNERFRGERYPASGEESGEAGGYSDREAGLLEDSGREMPFIDRIIFKLEKEAIPRWNKFLQGYYDASGISSEAFDQAVTISTSGTPEVTETMGEKGIRLMTSVRPSVYYMAFNMLDPVVGGYSEEARKLRRAISIAVDFDEYIEIFNNGRGVSATGPIPPGIFGNVTGREGLNPYVFSWDEESGRERRRSIDEAKRLLAEAGYPGGRTPDGKALTITFDNSFTGAENEPQVRWYVKRLKLLGIQLANRTTDYNRFREKMLGGNFQLTFWGWNADYPDPENFLFLLLGSNSKVKHQGENVANYDNPDFNRLFNQMENMDNGAERLEIINRMVDIAREDSPWIWGINPVAFSLSHSWIGNQKSNSMANNTMKYIKIDSDSRLESRRLWNRPKLWPIAVVTIIGVIVIIPAALKIRRHLT